MVLTRARSCRVLRMVAVSLSRFVKFLNRAWNTSLASDFSSSWRCSVVRSRRSFAFIALTSDHAANEELGVHRKLVAGEPEGLARHVFRHAADLVHHAAGLHLSRPLFRGALAPTHPDFEGLLGDGAIREDPDPELAGALDVPLDGHTGGLDLTRGEARRLETLEPEVAEGDVTSGGSDTAVVALLRLAELGSLG